MITIIFLAFIALFAVGGVIISIVSKKRSSASRSRPPAVGDSPTIGRATGPGDD